MEAGALYLLALKAAGVGQACHIQYVVTDPHPRAGRCVAGTAAECPEWKVLYGEVAAFGHWQHTRTCEFTHVSQTLLDRSIIDWRGVCAEVVRFTNNVQEHKLRSYTG